MNTTSLSLIERIRSPHDSEAWSRFVTIYSPLILRWAVRSGLTDADAADVAQDVFVTLLKEIKAFEYDSNRRNFRGWIKTITVNKVRDRLRHRLRLREADAESINPQDLADRQNIDAFWDGESRKHLAAQALRLMKSDFEPMTWQAAWLALTTERTAADIGQEIGLAEASVWVAKSRVLRKLRKEMAGMLDG